MVSKKKPDWPPPGWKVDIKVKNGRKIKYYINSKTRQKFYSKPAVLRYIKDGCVSNEKLQPLSEHAKKNSGKERMHLVEANDSEWLPTGWVIERRIRKSGAKVGTEYKCFIDPSTGTKFFSKPEVLRYLGSKQSSAGSSRRKDEGGSGNSSSKRSVDQLSADKSKLEPKVSQISKTRVQKSLSSGKLKVVIERTMDEELPSGWIKETRTKKRGNKVVRRDPFFLDPASRLVFRSKLEVLRYVETGEISRHAYQRRNGNSVGEDFAVGNTSTSSSGKTEEAPKSRTRKQLFAGEGCSGQSIQAVSEAEGNEEAGGRKSKTSSRVRRPRPAGASNHKQSTLSPDSVSSPPEMVAAKPLLEKVSASNTTVGMSTHTPPDVQDADVKDAFSQKSEPSSATSRGVLPEENPEAAEIQGCNNGKAQTSKRKTKDGKLASVPSRSSKRLAGVDAAVVFHPIPIEHALRALNKKPSKTMPIPSLGSVPNEFEEKHQDDVDQKDLNKDALQAIGRKRESSRTKPLASVKSVSSERHEKHQDQDTQNELASQEEKRHTVDVKTDTVLSAQGEQPLNKIDDSTFQEDKHHTVESEIMLTTQGTQSLEKIDDLTSLEAQRHTLDIDLETVLATQGESLNKFDDLPSQEENQLKLDVDSETVCASLGEPSNKVNDFTTKNRVLVDLNDLQLEAPPGFSENEKAEASSIPIKQSMKHPTDTLLGSKVENASKGRPILEERSEEQLPSSERQAAEQPQSEFCFSAPLWSDPCLEFAFKTLTGAIPFDDNLAIQDYIQHQLRTSEQSPSPDISAPSSLKNDESKVVSSQLPEDVNFPNSNGFGTPEMKQVKNK